jgi:hypothetical protein
MLDKTYIVRFKSPQIGVQVVAASSAEIHGDHIALLKSNGQLAALLLLEIVESWRVVFITSQPPGGKARQLQLSVRIQF